MRLSTENRRQALSATDSDVGWGASPRPLSSQTLTSDVVPQALVVQHELANRLRELVTLPLALQSPCRLALACGRGSTCGLDRIGGRAEFVRGHMRDGPGLAGSVRGMPCCPRRFLAAPMAWPPAARACIIVT